MKQLTLPSIPKSGQNIVIFISYKYFLPMKILFPPLSIVSWLIAALVLVTLPHALHLAIWVLPIFYSLLALRYLITRYQWRLPPRWIQLAIAFLVMFGVLFSYHTWFGRDAGIALLIGLCGLKILEMQNRRDVLLLCFLIYFLVITNFLYSQTIPMVLYMSLVVWIVTATLVNLSDQQRSLSAYHYLRLSATLLLQALPLMLVFFLFFPRISGSLWGLPKDAHEGSTGLSDTLILGDVSNLTLSDKIAFRVKFADKVPPPSQRYWRGPVLWWNDGYQWRARQPLITKQVRLQPLSRPIDYAVTLEPHNERWLLVLDMPAYVPPKSRITLDYQILSTFPITQRLRYQQRSYVNYRALTTTHRLRRWALQLPHGKHPKTRALAAQWLQKETQPQALIQQTLTYFNQQAFTYTYSPPITLEDPVDQFLFETRMGFCEHYAAAFTVLMRAMDIPTRLVTGYLGGEINPIDNYLVVRQRDAHAWTEVWLADQGWVRIDPTAAVAPERIERGSYATSAGLSPLGIQLNPDATFMRWWQQVRYRWDAFNNTWNQWILGYDLEQQKQFFNYLGLEQINWQGMLMILIVAVSGLWLGIAIWLFWQARPRQRSDSIYKTYQHFCDKLAHRGLARHPAEGPLTFAARVSTSRPDLATQVQQITYLYTQARYRSQSDLLSRLRKKVRLFRP